MHLYIAWKRFILNWLIFISFYVQIIKKNVKKHIYSYLFFYGGFSYFNTESLGLEWE